jgi:hypothetical protein
MRCWRRFDGSADDLVECLAIGGGNAFRLRLGNKLGQAIFVDRSLEG